MRSSRSWPFLEQASRFYSGKQEAEEEAEEVPPKYLEFSTLEEVPPNSRELSDSSPRGIHRPEASSVPVRQFRCLWSCETGRSGC